MIQPNRLFHCVEPLRVTRTLRQCLVMLLALGSGVLVAGERPLLGGVDISTQRSSGAALAIEPSHIYIADFSLDAAATSDSADRPVLGRLAERVKALPGKDSPQQQAARIVSQMTDELIRQFSQQGLPASRWQPGISMPQPSWLVQGMFTEVGKGSRIGRAVIGFGRHASRMDIQLQVSDLSLAPPISPFLYLGTAKDPSKLPGAIVTRNPYVAVAKFALDKQATEQDIEQTAQAIVERVLQFRAEVAPRS